MFSKLIDSFVRGLGWNLGKRTVDKVTNKSDTRWECECCGAIKPKVAQKFYTTDGVVCRKCNKGV